MQAQFERKRIGEFLVEMGSLAPAEVKIILEQMAILQKRFGETGLAEGFFNEDVLAQALAKQFGLEYLDLDRFTLDQALLSEFPPGLAIRYHFLPVERRNDCLVVAIVAAPVRRYGIATRNSPR
jgi:type IV pilus assembly protein PilB